MTRSSGTGRATVDYAVSGAAQANDFAGGVLPSGTVTFRSGETSKLVTILVAGDTAVEANESFSVALSNPQKGTVAGGPAAGLIQNDDFYQLAVAPLSAVKPEGDAATTDFTFTVSRTGGTSGAVSAQYAVSGTGGLDAADFGGTLPSGTVTIPDGQASTTLTVAVSGDTAFEADEDFTVTLSNPSANAEIATATADGTIENDDAAYQVSIAPFLAATPEGDAGTTGFSFLVSRTGGTAGDVTLDYVVAGLSAGLDAADFGGALPDGTVTIPDGQASTVLTIPVSGDTTVEFDEDFTVTLSNPSANAEIVDGDATGTIQNDEPVPIQRISVSSAGAQANSFSQTAKISMDGRYVTFLSFATNLVPGDTNGLRDTFVRDVRYGTTERVSIASDEAQAFGGTGSSLSSISGEGDFVAFGSYATNLVAGDTNLVSDIFVRDRTAGTTERVSVSSGESQADGDSLAPWITPTIGGAIAVAFSSSATNLVAGDTNAGADIFVRDLQAGATERVSVNSNENQAVGPLNVAPVSEEASISADNRFVAFTSNAANLTEITPGVFGDGNSSNDIFLRDRIAGSTAVVSVNSDEQAASFGIGGGADNGEPEISADGRFVVFESFADNFVQGAVAGTWNGDTNGAYDIFVRDRVLGTTERISVDSDEGQGTGGPARPDSLEASISADGRYVVFSSLAENLVENDTNETWDVFLRDRDSGTTTRISVDGAGTQANEQSIEPSISADGRYVAFRSLASNLVPNDTNNEYDLFVVDGQAQGWWFA